jgi:hypothetical protein
LLEAREALVHEATCNRNRLHAHLLVLAPGYHRRNLSGVALLADTRSSPRMRPLGSSATAACDDLWGSMPIVIT